MKKLLCLTTILFLLYAPNLFAASAITYTLNNSPALTDQVIGIDDPSGTWAINRFSLTKIGELLGQYQGTDGQYMAILPQNTATLSFTNVASGECAILFDDDEKLYKFCYGDASATEITFHEALTLSSTINTNLLSLTSQELGLDTQTANYIFAGPTTGAAAAPAFRALVSTDIPTLNQNTTGTAAGLSSTLAVASGGTGQTTEQLAINALTNASGATNEYVLTKDTATGNAIFKASTGSDDLGSATYSDVVDLWASGSCTGYLKSNGECDIPEGTSGVDVGDALIDGGTASASDTTTVIDGGESS